MNDTRIAFFMERYDEFHDALFSRMDRAARLYNEIMKDNKVSSYIYPKLESHGLIEYIQYSGVDLIHEGTNYGDYYCDRYSFKRDELMDDTWEEAIRKRAQKYIDIHLTKEAEKIKQKEVSEIQRIAKLEEELSKLKEKHGVK